MNDTVNDSEIVTGDDLVTDPPVTTDQPAPASQPAPTPPPGDSEQVAAFKKAALDERQKRQDEAAKRQIAEKELERYQNEQATNNFDPLDPESVQTLVRSEAQKIADAADAQRRAEAETKSWNARIAEGRSKYPDAKIDEIVNDGSLPVSDAMAAVIKQSPDGIDLLVHLNSNRELSQKIALMSPTEAYVEMGRISASIKDAGPSLSNAPDPITPVGSRSVTNKATDDMTLEEYEAHVKEKRGGSVFPT